ncbi:MAG TPA: helix-turn-helix transcriptional regulator [Candidatus Binatia bacterium]
MRLNGNLLKTGRDKKGLTQQQLADAVGVSVPTIVNAEQEANIWPSTGRAICDYLGIPLEKAVLPRQDRKPPGNNGDDEQNVVAR